MLEVVDQMAYLDPWQVIWSSLGTIHKNLNIKFDQEVFIMDFELCKDRIARRFPELDLGFLEEEKDDVEGVSIKPLIKNLRKELHLLRKKLTKMEDDLRASRNNASKATKEVTHL
ncbi:hypothetical protein COCNU_scaffold002054G000010 [Cocos nucifera]|nr:hypothetical protein [Cocos nucifera]